MSFDELKDIPGLEDLYAITREGKVWSYPKGGRSGRWLTGAYNSDGYHYFCLRFAGEQIYPRTSQLVLETYVGPRPEGCEADHLDNDRGNDRLDNLRWVSRKENVARIFAQGRRTMVGTKNSNAFLTEEDVIQLRTRRRTSTLTYSALAAEFNLKKSHVADIITGRVWKHLPL